MELGTIPEASSVERNDSKSRDSRVVSSSLLLPLLLLLSLLLPLALGLEDGLLMYQGTFGSSVPEIG